MNDSDLNPTNARARAQGKPVAAGPTLADRGLAGDALFIATRGVRPLVAPVFAPRLTAGLSQRLGRMPFLRSNFNAAHSFRGTYHRVNEVAHAHSRPVAAGATPADRDRQAMRPLREEAP
ncbi:hypothetical protein ACOBQX_22960 [Actinokineospora sp. G85]|uniref:hypothetical protein n=1 Tax=Actinokineospora sp. G85 TaxID=3406626 RepID=UPI003C76E981